MKILHIADLHIGKVVNAYSMLDEQAYALDQIITIIESNKVDVLIIAGDVYDKRVPSEDSVRLFNDFLNKISNLNIVTLIVSGNHDSGVKLQFGHEIFKDANIHIVGEFRDEINKVIVNDDYGIVNFYLLPFIRPSDVRKYDNTISSYSEAVKYAIESCAIDYNERNVFIGHQFFTSGKEEITDSEQFAIGGIDNVSHMLISEFDYSALGHLHRPQRLMDDFIRYSGSLVKYSLSEINDNKSVVLLTLNEKGNKLFELIDIKSKRQFKHVEAYIEEILQMDKSDDYYYVTLKDDEVYDALNKVKSIFPNLMTLDFNNTRTASSQLVSNNTKGNLPPDEMFAELFELQNNSKLSATQKAIVMKVIEGVDRNASN